MTPKTPANDPGFDVDLDESEADVSSILDNLDIDRLVDQLEALVVAPETLVKLDDELRRRLQEAAGYFVWFPPVIGGRGRCVKKQSSYHTTCGSEKPFLR